MKYEINGTTMPVVEITLDKGESVFTESGGMSWMDDGIEMQTNGKGGLGKMIGRALAGESLFMTTYTATRDAQQIAFVPEMPGKVIPIELKAGQSLIAQRDAFMVAQEGVEMQMHFRRRLGAGLFGGEGFIMQRLTGPGLVFVEVGGEVVKRELARGEVLKVDPGHIAMMDTEIDFDVEMVKGLGNMFLGGEGLFISKLTGPGRVWLQTMPLSNLAKAIYRFLPKSSSS
ncbi:MAG: TIGR00266 family protein [Phototrophicaceae bacterium]